MKESKIRSRQELVYNLFWLYSSKVESREKVAEFSYSVGFMAFYERIGLLRVCSDGCHQYFMFD